jgi:hypothetical protein
VWRAAIVLACLSATAFAQPAPPPPALAVTEPAPPSSTPPTAYPLPSSSAPPVYPGYSPPRERPDRFFFALGILGGFSNENNWLYGAYTGELAMTILPAHEFVIRARAFGVLYGGTMESDWNGDMFRLGAGLEVRWCGAHTCVFADGDAGYQKLSLDDDRGVLQRKDTGLLIGPRFGFDWGGALRARFALEIYELFATHTPRTGAAYFDAVSTIGVSAGVGYQF